MRSLKLMLFLLSYPRKTMNFRKRTWFTIGLLQAYNFVLGNLVSVRLENCHLFIRNVKD